MFEYYVEDVTISLEGSSKNYATWKFLNKMGDLNWELIKIKEGRQNRWDEFVYSVIMKRKIKDT